jgi:hypothetical protein
MFSFFKKKQEISNSPEHKNLNEPELLFTTFFFKEKPKLEREKILKTLKKRFNQIEGENLIFFFPEYLNQFSDGTVPAQAVIVEQDKKGIDLTKFDNAFNQSWHWEKVRLTMNECSYQFSLTDILSRGLEYKLRVEYFQKFVDSIIEATNPQALYFKSSDKVVEPKQYLDRGDAYLYGLMNVRLFNISNEKEGKILMDTIGLSSLGLADWQIRFDDYDPDIIARLLTNYGYHVFEKGNVINHGDTIQGKEKADKWRCSFEDSIVEPTRRVYNIITKT